MSYELSKMTQIISFLELAEVSQADFIITGNTNDFTMQTYKTTLIVTPREYWEKHRY